MQLIGEKEFKGISIAKYVYGVHRCHMTMLTSIVMITTSKQEVKKQTRVELETVTD